MGAINFKGGSWVGGGDGLLFTFETDECLNCRRSYPCECEEPMFYDYEYEKDIYQHVSSNLDQIIELLQKAFNKLPKEEKEKRTYEIFGKKVSLWEILWPQLDSFSYEFLTVESGYNQGFQLIPQMESGSDSVRGLSEIELEELYAQKRIKRLFPEGKLGYDQLLWEADSSISDRIYKDVCELLASNQKIKEFCFDI